MTITRADRRLGRLVAQFLQAHTHVAEPLFVLMCWEGNGRDADPADLHIITNAGDDAVHAALDLARAEIDDPSP
jgi:hypothetical protein